MSDKLLFERFVIALLACDFDKKTIKKIEFDKWFINKKKLFFTIKPIIINNNEQIVDKLRRNSFFYGFYRGSDFFGGSFEIPFDVFDEWALLCERCPQGDNCYVDKHGKIHQQNLSGMRGERV